MEAVECSGGALLLVVHRPEPEPTLTIDHTVVQAIVRAPWLDLYQQLELALLRIEVMEAALQSGDEAAALGWKHESDLLRRIPASPLGSGRIEAVNLLLLDVDEPERLVTLDPDGPLAQRRAHFPDQMRFTAHFVPQILASDSRGREPMPVRVQIAQVSALRFLAEQDDENQGYNSRNEGDDRDYNRA